VPVFEKDTADQVSNYTDQYHLLVFLVKTWKEYWKAFKIYNAHLQTNNIGLLHRSH